MIEVRRDLTADQWNEGVCKCVNFNIFASWEWGEYKAGSWEVERLAFYKNGSLIGLTQILFKNVAGHKLGWCSSGINVVNYKNLSEIIDQLGEIYNLKKTAIRLNSFDEATGETLFSYDEISSLTTVDQPINSGYTVRFDDLNAINIPSDFSKNNRYYLKQSQKENLKFEVLDKVDVNLFVEIHNSMANMKELEHLKVSQAEIDKVSKCFGDKIKMFVVRASNGNPLSSCLILTNGQYGYYYLAGSTEEARKASASFFMISELLEYLRSNGITKFDFGGITPFKENAKGVNRFKFGFGGRIIKYVGERNICKSKSLNYLFNKVIASKLS